MPVFRNLNNLTDLNELSSKIDCYHFYKFNKSNFSTCPELEQYQVFETIPKTDDRKNQLRISETIKQYKNRAK